MTWLVDRITRAVLTILALLLLAGGLVVLAIGAGMLPRTPPDTRLVDPTVASALHTASGWLPWAVLGGSVLLAVVGTWWLIALLHSHRLTELPLPGEAGPATITTTALRQAAVLELGRSPGLALARLQPVRARGPRLLLGIEVAADSEPTDLLHTLTDQVLPRLQEHTAISLPTHVDLTPARREHPRVR
jgi:hypothetical protein